MPVVRERSTPPASRRNDVLVPNVVIPGVSHAGAAVLAGQFGRHPQVCLPSVKRIGHFSSLRYGRPVHEPLEEYDRHFARWTGQRYRLENAPDYFDGGLPMARQVAESLPGARVVIVLRDPSERLWASYTDKLARGRLPRATGFESYVERCIALRTNGADRFEGNRHFRTLSSGFYAEYLPAWLETFGRRARVVFTEDLQESAADHVGALFDWLGLDPDDVTPTPDDADLEAYPRSEPSGLSFNLSFNPRLWPVRQRPSGPRLAERTRARVRAVYAGANRELAAQLHDLGYSGLPEWLTRA